MDIKDAKKNLISTYALDRCLGKHEAIIDDECVEVKYCDVRQSEVVNDNGVEGSKALGYVLRSSKYDKCCPLNTSHSGTSEDECTRVTTCDNVQYEILDKNDPETKNTLGEALRGLKYTRCCPLTTVHLDGEPTRCFHLCGSTQYRINENKGGKKDGIGRLIYIDNYQRCCEEGYVHKEVEGNLNKILFFSKSND